MYFSPLHVFTPLHLHKFYCHTLHAHSFLSPSHLVTPHTLSDNLFSQHAFLTAVPYSIQISGLYINIGIIIFFKALFPAINTHLPLTTLAGEWTLISLS